MGSGRLKEDNLRCANAAPGVAAKMTPSASPRADQSPVCVFLRPVRRALTSAGGSPGISEGSPRSCMRTGYYEDMLLPMRGHTVLVSGNVLGSERRFCPVNRSVMSHA